MFCKMCRIMVKILASVWVAFTAALLTCAYTVAGAAQPPPPSIEEVCGTYAVTFINDKQGIRIKGQLTFVQKGKKLVLHTGGKELKNTQQLQFIDGLEAMYIVDRVMGEDPSNLGNQIHLNVRQSAGSKGTFFGSASYSAVKKNVVTNLESWQWRIQGERLSSTHPEEEKEAAKEGTDEGRDTEGALDDLSDHDFQVVMTALTTSLIGSALGGAAAGVGGISGLGGGSVGYLGPHLSRDNEGDLHLTDSTGRERVYINQGDGTYREVGGFGRVFQKDLEEEARRLQESMGYYQQIEKQKQEVLKVQREQAKEMSQTMKQILAEKRKEAVKSAKEQYMDKLRQKYGVYGDDGRILRERMQEKIDRAAQRAKKQERIAKGFDVALKAAETTQVIADVGVNVLATATGQVGIRDAYTAAKNMAGSLSDAVVNNKNLGTAMAQGALNTLADLTTNKLENAGWHITGNAASAGFKKMLDNACKGAPLMKGVTSGMVAGGMGGAVAKGADALSDWTGKGISRQANNYVHGGMTGMRHNLNIKKVCTEAEFRAIENLRLTALLEGVRGKNTQDTLATGITELIKWACGETAAKYEENEEAARLKLKT